MVSGVHWLLQLTMAVAAAPPEEVLSLSLKAWDAYCSERFGEEIAFNPGFCNCMLDSQMTLQPASVVSGNLLLMVADNKSMSPRELKLAETALFAQYGKDGLTVNGQAHQDVLAFERTLETEHEYCKFY